MRKIDFCVGNDLSFFSCIAEKKPWIKWRLIALTEQESDKPFVRYWHLNIDISMCYNNIILIFCILFSVNTEVMN